MRSGTAALFWKEWRESGVPLGIAVVLTASWEVLLAMQQQRQPQPGVPGAAWTSVFWPFELPAASGPNQVVATRIKTAPGYSVQEFHRPAGSARRSVPAGRG